MSGSVEWHRQSGQRPTLMIRRRLTTSLTTSNEERERVATMESNDLLMEILKNQRSDGERLARVEVLTEEMKTDIIAVKTLQVSCPGRIAEMQRQARKAAWVTAGKLLGWFIGIVTACAGAWQAIAAVFGG